jgi:large subunit ribosomal protein L22
MEKRALLKYARITPRKARRVMDLIKGKTAGEAMVSLRFMPYRGARLVEKVLRSAMANAEQANAPDAEQLKVSKAIADAGPVMKRMQPRAMGRANIIKKRMSHLSIYLSDEEK